ncbi:hypothetical protein HNP82_001044 [Catenibacillus scindens]|uniref:Uncharacterized protein n=1 Tax=Catenibacillus scindens TaxID=673271 RepID=A0A7W8H8M6_9FIRM|nr:hypothetical protein [Catenibacillus scindens]
MSHVLARKKYYDGGVVDGRDEKPETVRRVH